MDKLICIFLLALSLLITNLGFAQPGPNKTQMTESMNINTAKMVMVPGNEEMMQMDHDMMVMSSRMMARHMLMMSMKMRMMGKVMSMSNDTDMMKKGKNMMSMSMQLYTMARELMRDNNMSPKDVMSEPMMGGMMMDRMQ